MKLDKKHRFYRINQLVLISAVCWLATSGLSWADDALESSPSPATSEVTVLPGMTKAIDTDKTLSKYGVYNLGGKLLVDRNLEATQGLQTDKQLDLVGISTPSYNPSSNHIFFFYNDSAKAVCEKFADGSSQCLTPEGGSLGTISGVTAGYGLSGGGVVGNVTLNLINNSTSYIQNRATLQSGATFYVSSGTVNNLTASTGTFSTSVVIGGSPTLSNSETDFLEIVNNGSTVPSQSQIKISSYGDPAVISAQNVIHYYRARGSVASPSATLSGDFIADTGYRGYANGVYTNSQASDRVETTENWDSTHLGCKFHWETTPTGGTTRTPILDLTGNGLSLLGSSTVDMGSNKITSLANGTASTDAAAFGQVKLLQTVMCTNATTFNVNNSTYQITGLSCSITPRSTSNDILIMATGPLVTQAGNTADALATLYRGNTTNLGPATGFAQCDAAIAGADFCPVTMIYLDAPATTSATTYRVMIKNDASATIGWGTNSVQQVMILQEVVP